MRDRNPRELWLTLAAIVLVATFAGLVSGCGAFVKPETLDQRLASAYTVHTAVIQAAGTAVAMGDITSDQGQAILDIADRTRTILDGARLALGSGDIKTAEGQLALALGLLTELQRHLRSRS